MRQGLWHTLIVAGCLLALTGTGRQANADARPPQREF